MTASSAPSASPTVTWTLLLDGARPGWANMALDQTLLDLADREGRCLFRIYRWQPFCLSFGRHEPALRRYDRSRIEALGLDLVRRPTGGRAVWHARELTYAVAAPVSVFGSLANAYRTIHQTLARAVNSLGLRATLAPSPTRATSLGAGACFASAAGGEVLVQGRKVAGSAQLQQGTAFLQHGSLLIEDDQRAVGQVARGAMPEGSERPLSQLLGRTVGFEEAAQALTAAAGEWDVEWQKLGDERWLLDLARSHQPRFQDPDWTWRR